MALKEYSTVINGMATTVQLSDEDAKLQGFTKKDLVSNQPVEVTEAQRDAANEDAARAEAEAKAKAEEEAEAQRVAAEEAEAKAAAAPANKEAAAPENKSASQTKRDEAVSRAMNKPRGNG